MDRRLAELMQEMMRYDHGNAARIQHFVKVHDLAAAIGILEGLDEESLYILEAAAILHDIGIRVSMEKYGSGNGKNQEKEGPPEAERLMTKIGGLRTDQVERVKYLIAHHHTYDEIDGLDYQILIEADFLVNLHESGERYSALLAAQKNIFRTETGRGMLTEMFEIYQ